MCFQGDSPSVYRKETPRARVAHECIECRTEIPPGDRYELASGLWDGRWDHFKTCGPCVVLRSEVTAVEESDGCWGTEAIPPFTELFSAAEEMGFVCRLTSKRAMAR